MLRDVNHGWPFRWEIFLQGATENLLALGVGVDGAAVEG